MNILLIGTAGSGKSSIGMTAATMLNMRYVELDDVVLAHSGFSSIDDVYRERVSLWKECELEVSKDISMENNTVFVCGGGFVENELNITYFREHSSQLYIFYVHAQPKTIVKRLMALNGTKREDVEENVHKLYTKRDGLCRQHADKVIENERREVIDASLEIVTFVRSQKA